MSALDRPARHVPVEERPEVKAFATELRQLFDSLDMSLGLFCRINPNVDKSALSRYLNGKRVPRDRWLLDRLFALRVEAGTPLTDEARDHLTGLQLAALQVAHSHDYRVRQVTDELNDTVTALRESKRHITSLENELAERARRLADLAAANQHLRTAWDAERLTAQQTIGDLTAQLALARKNHARAEEHRRELEALLDRLDTAYPDDHGDDTTSAGVRFQTAVEALQAPTPQQRTAAIHELIGIARQNPVLHEAVIGTLLGYLRTTATTPEEDTPSLLPAATHHTEPLHAALHALLELNDDRLLRTDLSGANLSETHLREVDLREANLRGANLLGADLSGADLSGVNLHGATLSETDLRGADLRGANLSAAVLINTNLGEANLGEANLRKANLSEANLHGAILSGADLRGTILRRAVLTNTDLRGVYMSGADLSEAYLRGANLREADLREAYLSQTDLSGAIGLPPSLTRRPGQPVKTFFAHPQNQG